MKNSELTHQLQQIVKRIMALRIAIFIGVVCSVYALILWHIHVVSTMQPNQAAISSQGLTQPHIDQTVVNKITQLQDNSVNVQTLFNSARQNPFHE